MSELKTREDRWDIQEAKETIQRNGGKIKDKQIVIGNAGIKVLGAIDFLINYHGYRRG